MKSFILLVHLCGLFAWMQPECRQPVVPGPCVGYLERFFYNITTKTCEQFIYGGCKGNDNNFHSLAQCETACYGVLSRSAGDAGQAFHLPWWWMSPPQVCIYPPEIGPCKAHEQRFFYNAGTNKCELFFFGGCGGNANNFATSAACEKKCKTIWGVFPRA